jgi:hypothetical protein
MSYGCPTGQELVVVKFMVYGRQGSTVLPIEVCERLQNSELRKL